MHISIEYPREPSWLENIPFTFLRKFQKILPKFFETRKKIYTKIFQCKIAPMIFQKFRLITKILTKKKSQKIILF